MEELFKPLFNLNDNSDPRATEIIPRLFLGDEDASKDSLLLDKLKIVNIVKVGQELEMKFPQKYNYMNIDIYDHDEENIYQYFESTFDFIQEALNKNEGVLVHCKFGISRSSTIVCSYLIQKFEYRCIEAISFVSSKRFIINPNQGFIRQLEELSLRKHSNLLGLKYFKKSNYSNLPIEKPYVIRNEISCRIKLLNEEKEEGIVFNHTKGRMEDMFRDKCILKFVQILSSKREEILHLKLEDQKRLLTELVKDKTILTEICFKTNKKNSKKDEGRRLRNLRKKLKNNTSKVINFLIGSKFEEDIKKKLSP